MSHILEIFSLKKQLFRNGRMLMSETRSFEIQLRANDTAVTNSIEKFRMTAICSASAPSELQLLCFPLHMSRESTFSKIPSQCGELFTASLSALDAKFGRLTEVSVTPDSDGNSTQSQRYRFEFDRDDFVQFLRDELFSGLKQFVIDAEHFSDATPATAVFRRDFEEAAVTRLQEIATKLRVFAECSAASPRKRKELFLTQLVAQLQDSAVFEKRFAAGLDPTVAEAVTFFVGTSTVPTKTSRVL